MSTKFSNRPVYEQSHEEHVAAGKKGGQARGNHGAQRRHDDDDNDMQSSPKRSRSNSTSGKSGNGGNGKMSRAEAGHLGGIARAKKSGQNSNYERGNDYDPESDKYGYDDGNNDDSFNDGIAAHTRSHDNNNSNNNADNNYDDNGDDDQGQSRGGNNSGRRSNGKQPHSDFESGKNPNRQAVSRRIARERGHDAFVEMGRKGGAANAGIHADLDYDDMESFKSHPEQGVPAKNPNRVQGGKQAAQKRGHDEFSEMGRIGGQANAGRGKFGGTVDMGEDDNESFTERDLVSPNRRAGGIRAASKQSHESFVERGRMGAEARWGNNRQQGGSNGRGNQGNGRGNQNNQQEDDEFDEQDGDDTNSYGKDSVRVQAGKKAAQTRAEHGTQYRGGNRSANQQRGSQGRSNNQNDDDQDDDMDQSDDDNDDNGNRQNLSRGQKAAQTRARNGTQSNGSRQSGGNSCNSRGGNGNNRGKSFETVDDDDNYDDMNQDHFEDDQGKNPNRVRGGKQAASHFSHQELSERAHRAAETRRQSGTQSRNGSGISRQSQGRNRNQDDDEDME